MAGRGKNVPKTDKAPKPAAKKSRRRTEAAGANGLPAGYWKACELALDASGIRRSYLKRRRLSLLFGLIEIIVQARQRTISSPAKSGWGPRLRPRGALQIGQPLMPESPLPPT
jgi:hypothetical protein